MARSRRHDALWRSDRGAAAVEFALLLPLLMLIVCGIIDFGGQLNAQNALTQAAREGVRLAALGKSDAEIETWSKNAATSPLLDTDHDGQPDINFGTVLTCPQDDENAKVTLTFPYHYVTPVGSFGVLLGGSGGLDDPITLSATGVMPC